MKKIFSIFKSFYIYLFIALILINPIKANAVKQVPDVNIPIYKLIDLHSSKNIAQKSENTIVNGNSILPMLIILTANDKVKVDDDILITSKSVDVYSKMLATNKLNLLGVKKSEKIKVSYLYQAILLNNSQDAINALSTHISKNDDEFLKLIKEKATKLKLNKTKINTIYIGKDQENTTTVNDLCIAMKAFVSNANLLELAKIRNLSIPANNMVTEVRKVPNPNAQVDSNSPLYFNKCEFGIKVTNTEFGQTYESYISYYKKDNQELIFAGAKASTMSDLLKSSKTLSEWSFNNYKSIKVIDKNVSLSQYKLPDGTKLPLKPQDDLYLLTDINDTTDYTNVSNSIKLIDLPKNNIVKGDALGFADILVGDRKIGSVNLIATENVDINAINEKVNNPSFFSKLLSLLGKILIVLIILALVSAIFIIYKLIQKNKLKQKQLELRRKKYQSYKNNKISSTSNLENHTINRRTTSRRQSSTRDENVRKSNRNNR